MSGGIVITKYDNGLEYSPGREGNAGAGSTIPVPMNIMPGEASEPIFSDSTIRLGFLRKVFGIFTTQLILTLALIGSVNFIDSIRNLIEASAFLFAGIPVVLASVLFIFLMIKKEMTMRFPLNFVFLALFTIFFGFGVASISTLAQKEDVLYAGGILLCSTVAVTLYTLQSRFDLKWHGHLLIVMGSVSLVTVVIYFAIPPKEEYVLIVSATGSLIISIYLAILTQSIMSGNCMEFRPENYVLVSLSAYLVVIMVFLVALLILAAVSGGCKDCGGGDGGGRFCYCPLYCGPYYGHSNRKKSEDTNEGSQI